MLHGTASTVRQGLSTVTHKAMASAGCASRPCGSASPAVSCLVLSNSMLQQ